VITLIGIGHVFDISQQVRNVILETKPQAVCVELDKYRYMALSAKTQGTDSPFIYQLLARFQKRIAGQYGVAVGNEMLTATDTARMIGAKVYLIDMDAQQLFKKMWHSMSFLSKLKFFFGSITSLFISKKRVESELKRFDENSEEYLKDIEEHFPVVSDHLIEQRNDFMARKVVNISKKYEDVAVFIGDGHVPGILKRLNKNEISTKVIRLRDLRKQGTFTSEADNKEVCYSFSST